MCCLLIGCEKVEIKDDHCLKASEYLLTIIRSLILDNTGTSVLSLFKKKTYLLLIVTATQTILYEAATNNSYATSFHFFLELYIK